MNGFPTAHLLCGRCGLACVGLYSGFTAMSLKLFASMVHGCAKNRDEFLVERDAHEQEPDTGSELGADAGSTTAQRAAVAAVIAGLRDAKELAACTKTLLEGEQYDPLKGERALDPKLRALRREAAVLRVNELNLRKMKNAIGKECIERARHLLKGQRARWAEGHAC